MEWPFSYGLARLAELLAYNIRLSKSAEQHFARLTPLKKSTTLKAMKVQLAHAPLRETRNRKPLRLNPLAPWELRLRLFYEVDAEDANVVNVLAIGIKRGNRLFIGGEETSL